MAAEWVCAWMDIHGLRADHYVTRHESKIEREGQKQDKIA